MQDTIVPLLHPITGVDGKTIHELHVQKGTDIFIDILGANHHPKTWGADASEWKPERWLSELPESVTKIRDLSGVYSHLCVSRTFNPTLVADGNWM
jgi:cytochrome P450